MNCSETNPPRGPLPRASGNACRKALQSWLEGLTPAGRLILVLHYAEDVTAEDIAAVMGLAPATVEQQLGCFRRQVRAILEKSEHGEADQ